jgi:low affinity Fe/Cu permease
MRIITFIAASVFATSAFAQTQLSDVPYWKLMQGWWRADNTYMDNKLDYNIRSYNSLIHVEINGRTYTETEYKFYPPSKLAAQYGKGVTKPDEGIETVTIIKGEMTDKEGTVNLTETLPKGPGGKEKNEIKVLSPDTGVRTTPNEATKTDTYRMFIFAPTPDKRYRSNFGLVSDKTGAGAANAAPDAKLGDLRGFSLFREDRIAAGDFESWRAKFRAQNNVKAIVDIGADGGPSVRRLD